MSESDPAPEPAPPRSRLRRLLPLVVIGVSVGAFGAMLLHYRAAPPPLGSTVALPLVQADPRPTKVKPEEPGGLQVPNQDKEVYERLAQSGEPTQERLMQPPERPVERPPAPEPAAQAPAAAPVVQTPSAPPRQADAAAPAGSAPAQGSPFAPPSAVSPPAAAPSVQDRPQQPAAASGTDAQGREKLELPLSPRLEREQRERQAAEARRRQQEAEAETRRKAADAEAEARRRRVEAEAQERRRREEQRRAEQKPAPPPAPAVPAPAVPAPAVPGPAASAPSASTPTGPAPAAPQPFPMQKTPSLEELLNTGRIVQRGPEAPVGPSADADAATTQKSLAPPAPAAPPPAAAAPVAPLPGPAAPPPVAPAAGAYFVQLAAFRSEADAEAAWRTFQQRHVDVLGQLGHRVLRADLGGKGVFYRLQAGSLATEAQARAACSTLAAKGQSCMVVRPG